MYIIVDVLALLFVLGLTLYGLKAGFFNSTVNLLLVIVCFAGSLVASYFTVTEVFAKWGWLEEITLFFQGVLGNSKIQGGQEIVDLVAYYLGLGLLIIITAIVYGVVLNIVRKLILGLFKKINSVAFFGFFDKLLGFIINFALSAGIVLAIMAFFYVFEEGGVMFTYANEVIRASEVLSFIHDINPLNALFSDLGIAETLTNLFTSM
ncbi:MAG: hypothetical protein IKL82_05005 [Clostridia bacterium]|nr:hypothetical protein [Clostridia bacterium]